MICDIKDIKDLVVIITIKTKKVPKERASFIYVFSSTPIVKYKECIQIGTRFWFGTN